MRDLNESQSNEKEDFTDSSNAKIYYSFFICKRRKSA